MFKSTAVRSVAIGAIGLMLIAATAGDSDRSSPYTRLSLQGRGMSQQLVEFVAITAAAETWARNPRTAMDENAAEMQALRARLKQIGIAENDVRTADFRFNRQSDPEDHDGDRDEGYGVQHQLAITVRDGAQAGKVMDILVAAGADNLSVNRGWGYGDDVSPQALKQARALAINDAMTKANDYAAALRMKVRRVVTIQDNSAYATDRPMPIARIAAADASTVIDNRPQTVLASVSMEFELER